MTSAAPTARHSVTTSADAEAIWFVGCLALIKASTESTGGAISVVEFTHPPDFATPAHVHHGEHEAFYILEGAMKGFCGDQEWRASAGDLVWLPRDVPHGYSTDGGERLRTLAITVPTGFERFVREAGVPAKERTVPSPSELDFPRLATAAAKYGQEFVEAGQRSG